ncbi:dihydroxyacetone kinase, DhaK subunit [Streptomyces sp. C]|nr:dihydroxyacetone kinase, DhaK subunit [Streptomyces sp. C]
MLINSPDTVVSDALRGMAAAHPELDVDVERQVVVRRDARAGGRVGLVSGGGSGHEPLHAGFVGPGMLSAACAGAVFTSPVPDQMLHAAGAVDAGQGVLFVVKNYTGDVLNFQMAAELAEEDGLRVERVLVDDDVAVTDSLYTAGRRGTGGTLFVEKIAGAAAEEGAPLERVAALARRVNDASRSFGVALSACTTPAKGSPTFDLPDAELELGVGIHGEPGRERRAMMTSREIAEGRCGRADDLAEARTTGRPGAAAVPRDGCDPAAGSCTGFPRGGRPPPWPRGASRWRGRSSGTTSPPWTWRAVSVTVCRADEKLLRLWDAPVRTAALRWGC